LVKVANFNSICPVSTDWSFARLTLIVSYSHPIELLDVPGLPLVAKNVKLQSKTMKFDCINVQFAMKKLSFHGSNSQLKSTNNLPRRKIMLLILLKAAKLPSIA
jgi:hypothetical protein